MPKGVPKSGKRVYLKPNPSWLQKGHTRSSDEKHGRWVGERAGYKAKHIWVNRRWGNAKDFKCQRCNGTSGCTFMDWANLDGLYSRDRDAWEPMCRKCHRAYDRDNLGSQIGRPKLKV